MTGEADDMVMTSGGVISCSDQEFVIVTRQAFKAGLQVAKEHLAR